jgi:hypothetical protein
MRAQATNRKRREELAAKAEGVSPAAEDPSDLMTVIGEELDRLPESHRSAVVVCDLDGLSRAAAAVRLGCTEGTLSARLHRGRKQLADRLRRRGITAPLSALIVLAGFTAGAPTGLGQGTAALAATVAARGISDRAVSTSVAALVSDTLREMVMRFTMKVLTVLVLSTGLVGGAWFGGPTVESRATAAPVPAVRPAVAVELSGPAYALLRHRKVLKELNCTLEQRDQIGDAFDELDEKRPPVPAVAIQFNGGGGKLPQELVEQIKEQNRRVTELAESESRSVARKYLSNDQLSRLGQIELQVRGLRAFADPKIAAALKLTDEQKSAVVEGLEASKADVPMARPVARGPLGPGGFRTEAQIDSLPLDPKRAKEALATFERGLTKDQQSAWQAMIGAKIGFELRAHVSTNTAIGTNNAGANPAGPAIPPAPPVPNNPKKN